MDPESADNLPNQALGESLTHEDLHNEPAHDVESTAKIASSIDELVSNARKNTRYICPAENVDERWPDDSELAPQSPCDVDLRLIINQQRHLNPTDRFDGQSHEGIVPDFDINPHKDVDLRIQNDAGQRLEFEGSSHRDPTEKASYMNISDEEIEWNTYEGAHFDNTENTRYSSTDRYDVMFEGKRLPMPMYDDMSPSPPLGTNMDHNADKFHYGENENKLSISSGSLESYSPSRPTKSCSDGSHIEVPFVEHATSRSAYHCEDLSNTDNCEQGPMTSQSMDTRTRTSRHEPRLVVSNRTDIHPYSDPDQYDVGRHRPVLSERGSRYETHIDSKTRRHGHSPPISKTKLFTESGRNDKRDAYRRSPRSVSPVPKKRTKFSDNRISPREDDRSVSSVARSNRNTRSPNRRISRSKVYTQSRNRGQSPDVELRNSRSKVYTQSRNRGQSPDVELRKSSQNVDSGRVSYYSSYRRSKSRSPDYGPRRHRPGASYRRRSLSPLYKEKETHREHRSSNARPTYRSPSPISIASHVSSSWPSDEDAEIRGRNEEEARIIPVGSSHKSKPAPVNNASIIPGTPQYMSFISEVLKTIKPPVEVFQTPEPAIRGVSKPFIPSSPSISAKKTPDIPYNPFCPLCCDQLERIQRLPPANLEQLKEHVLSYHLPWYMSITRYNAMNKAGQDFRRCRLADQLHPVLFHSVNTLTMMPPFFTQIWGKLIQGFILHLSNEMSLRSPYELESVVVKQKLYPEESIISDVMLQLNDEEKIMMNAHQSFINDGMRLLEVSPPNCLSAVLHWITLVNIICKLPKDQRDSSANYSQYSEKDVVEIDKSLVSPHNQNIVIKFWESIGKNHLRNLLELLMLHPQVLNEVHHSGVGPIQLALEKQNYIAARLLLFFGGDVDKKDTKGWTPLCRAAFTGNKDAMQVLLAWGASAQQEKALAIAKGEKHAEVLKMINDVAKVRKKVSVSNAQCTEVPKSALRKCEFCAFGLPSDVDEKTHFVMDHLPWYLAANHTRPCANFLYRKLRPALQSFIRKKQVPFDFFAKLWGKLLHDFLHKLSALLNLDCSGNLVSFVSKNDLAPDSKTEATYVEHIMMKSHQLYMAEENFEIKLSPPNCLSAILHWKCLRNIYKKLNSSSRKELAKLDAFGSLNDLKRDIYPKGFQMSVGRSATILKKNFWSYIETGNLTLLWTAILEHQEFVYLYGSDGGSCPIQSAISNGHPNAARLLLFYGAPTDRKDKDGFTPFSKAAYNGNTNLVSLLLPWVNTEQKKRAISVADIVNHKRDIAKVIQRSIQDDTADDETKEKTSLLAPLTMGKSTSHKKTTISMSYGDPKTTSNNPNPAYYAMSVGQTRGHPCYPFGPPPSMYPRGVANPYRPMGGMPAWGAGFPMPVMPPKKKKKINQMKRNISMTSNVKLMTETQGSALPKEASLPSSGGNVPTKLTSGKSSTCAEPQKNTANIVCGDSKKPKPAAKVTPPNILGGDSNKPKPAAKVTPPNILGGDSKKPKQAAKVKPPNILCSESKKPKPAAKVTPPNILCADSKKPKPAAKLKPPNILCADPKKPKPAAKVTSPSGTEAIEKKQPVPTRLSTTTIPPPPEMSITSSKCILCGLIPGIPHIKHHVTLCHLPWYFAIKYQKDPDLYKSELCKQMLPVIGDSFRSGNNTPPFGLFFKLLGKLLHGYLDKLAGCLGLKDSASLVEYVTKHQLCPQGEIDLLDDDKLLIRAHRDFIGNKTQTISVTPPNCLSALVHWRTVVNILDKLPPNQWDTLQKYEKYSGKNIIERKSVSIGDPVPSSDMVKFQRAVRENNLFSLWQLLNKSPNVANTYMELLNGITPLEYAISMGRFEEATMLLFYGALPDRPNRAGFTPLRNAARQGNIPAVVFLINWNPIAQIQDAYDAALSQAHKTLCKLLVTEYPNLSQTDVAEAEKKPHVIAMKPMPPSTEPTKKNIILMKSLIVEKNCPICDLKGINIEHVMKNHLPWYVGLPAPDDDPATESLLCLRMITGKMFQEHSTVPIIILRVLGTLLYEMLDFISSRLGLPSQAELLQYVLRHKLWPQIPEIHMKHAWVKKLENFLVPAYQRYAKENVSVTFSPPNCIAGLLYWETLLNIISRLLPSAQSEIHTLETLPFTFATCGFLSTASDLLNSKSSKIDIDSEEARTFTESIDEGNVAAVCISLEGNPELLSLKYSPLQCGVVSRIAAVSPIYALDSGTQILNCILFAGAAVDEADEIGMTALHHTVERKDFNTTITLLLWNADPCLKDNRGNTCFELAQGDSNLLLVLEFRKKKLFKKIALFASLNDESRNILCSQYIEKDVICIEKVEDIKIIDCPFCDNQILTASHAFKHLPWYVGMEMETNLSTGDPRITVLWMTLFRGMPLNWLKQHSLPRALLLVIGSLWHGLLDFVANELGLSSHENLLNYSKKMNICHLSEEQDFVTEKISLPSYLTFTGITHSACNHLLPLLNANTLIHLMTRLSKSAIKTIVTLETFSWSKNTPFLPGQKGSIAQPATSERDSLSVPLQTCDQFRKSLLFDSTALIYEMLEKHPELVYCKVPPQNRGVLSHSLTRDDTPETWYVVRLLVLCGVPIDAADNNGKTALYEAVVRDQIEDAMSLLLFGSNVHAKSTDGSTPFDVAKMLDRKSIYELFTYFENNGCTGWDLLQVVNRKMSKDKLNPTAAGHAVDIGDPEEDIKTNSEKGKTLEEFNFYRTSSTVLAKNVKAESYSLPDRRWTCPICKCTANSGRIHCLQHHLPWYICINPSYRHLMGRNKQTMLASRVYESMISNIGNVSDREMVNTVASCYVTLIGQLAMGLLEHIAKHLGLFSKVQSLLKYVQANRLWPGGSAELLPADLISMRALQIYIKDEEEDVRIGPPNHLSALLHWSTLINVLARLPPAVQQEVITFEHYKEPMGKCVIQTVDGTKGPELKMSLPGTGNVPVEQKKVFVKAITESNLTALSELLDKWPMLAYYPIPDSQGACPMWLALSSSQYTVPAVLYLHGASPDQVDCDGSSPLHCATKKGDMKAVQILVALGANVQMKNPQGHTAHDIAKQHFLAKIVAYLGMFMKGLNQDGMFDPKNDPKSDSVVSGEIKEIVLTEDQKQNTSVDLEESHKIKETEFRFENPLIVLEDIDDLEVSSPANILPSQELPKVPGRPNQDALIDQEKVVCADLVEADMDCEKSGLVMSGEVKEIDLTADLKHKHSVDLEEGLAVKVSPGNSTEFHFEHPLNIIEDTDNSSTSSILPSQELKQASCSSYSVESASSVNQNNCTSSDNGVSLKPGSKEFEGSIGDNINCALDENKLKTSNKNDNYPTIEDSNDSEPEEDLSNFDLASFVVLEEISGSEEESDERG